MVIYIYVTQTITGTHQHFNRSKTRVQNTCFTEVLFDVGTNTKLPVRIQIFKLIFYNSIYQNST